MIRSLRTSPLILAAGLVLAVPSHLFAEDAAKPAKGKPAKVEPAAPVGPPPVERARPETAALDTIIESKPKTPAQLFHAADLVAALGRADLGKVFLQQLLASKPSEDALAAVDKQYGSAEVLRVAQNRDLAPEGGQVADLILKAVAAHAQNPQRLAQQIARLADPAMPNRLDAFRELQAARTGAVAPLVTALADPKQAKLHPEIKTALVSLNAQIIEPLLGVMESDDADLKAQIVEVLGRLESDSVIPYLVVPYVSPKSSPALRAAAKQALLTIAQKTPTTTEAEAILKQRTAELFNRQRPFTTDSAGMIELWHWDVAKKQSVPVRYLAEEASTTLAGRFASHLHELFPDNEQYRRWYLVGMLDSAAYRAGLDKPVATGPGTPYEMAKGQTPAIIEDTLEYAMAQGHTAAATVAARLLGEMGHLDMLNSRGATACPLVLAAGNNDRRLRYAAVDSVLKLDPSKPFPGSSAIPEALGFFVRSFGAKKAVVGHPNAQQAEQLAALLREQGYEPLLATNGRDLFRLANSTADVELVLISSAIDRPTMHPLLQILRHDRQTALLPVGLLAATEDTDPVMLSAEEDPLAEGFPQPFESRAMEILVHRLQDRAGRFVVSAAERQKQAQGALDWLAAIARKPDQTLFDVRGQEASIRAALDQPSVAPTAAAVLGHFGTPSSQRTLAEVASRETQPLATRKAAAAAFNENVHKYGIRLTKQEILAQYTRYNLSQRSDAGTQAVLGSILDSLEAPTKGK